MRKLFQRLMSELKRLNFSKADTLELIRSVDLGWVATTRAGHLLLHEANDAARTVISAKVIGGEIRNLEPGPAFTGEVAQKIKQLADEVRAPHVHEFIYSRVMFSQKELKGNWKYGDRVQILPCLSEISYGTGLDWYANVRQGRGEIGSDAKGPPYPFLLEVSVPRVSNEWLQSAIGYRLLDQYENLLCTLIKGISGHLLWPTERQWMALQSPKDAGIQYHLLKSGIGTQRGGRYDSFTQWAKSPAKRFEGENYVDSLSAPQHDELVLPNELDQQMAAALGLDADTKGKLDRAVHYFCLGEKLRHNIDLAVLNFSISIESLLESGGERCANCKSHLGLKKSFQNFIAKYAPTNDDLKVHTDMLYAIRSKIAHGQRSSSADYYSFSLARDDTSPQLLQWLVRKSIINWLSDQSVQ